MVSVREIICNNCGLETEEGKNFCSNCGAKLAIEVTQPEIAEDKVKDISKDKKKLLVGIVGVLVAAGAAFVLLIASILIICILAGNGYKGTVKKFWKAFEKPNVSKMLDLSVPKSIQEEMFYKADEKKEFIEEQQEELEDAWEDLEYSDGEFRWEIKSAEKVGNLDIEEFRDEFREALEYDYEDFDFDVDEIEQVYVVEVKITLKMDGETDRDTDFMHVYKYKGKWYIYEGIDWLRYGL